MKIQARFAGALHNAAPIPHITRLFILSVNITFNFGLLVAWKVAENSWQVCAHSQSQISQCFLYRFILLAPSNWLYKLLFRLVKVGSFCFNGHFFGVGWWGWGAGGGEGSINNDASWWNFDFKDVYSFSPMWGIDDLNK